MKSLCIGIRTAFFFQHFEVTASLCGIKYNNMIPVPDNCLTQLKYNQVESFRSFSNEKEKTDYVYLLQKEKALIDNVQDTLQNKAMKLYQKCIFLPTF